MLGAGSVFVGHLGTASTITALQYLAPVRYQVSRMCRVKRRQLRCSRRTPTAARESCTRKRRPGTRTRTEPPTRAHVLRCSPSCRGPAGRLRTRGPCHGAALGAALEAKCSLVRVRASRTRTWVMIRVNLCFAERIADTKGSF